ncbi:hypothetical protein D1B31_16595 [Neobacillus notoginsengisoli]|uniref:Uncharacterized protein n=1 Tax=Neobacillus notoginsengisoli TaxID=1578198 RepID=A0A417YRR8_9BACI|nr:hypothetical protein D1B31_16595 [Neobacillus notoginsengisoli]
MFMKQKRKRLRDRQKPPRDRHRSPVSAMQIPGSFPLCPCDDYSEELSLVVIAVQTGSASTEIKESRRAKLLPAVLHELASVKSFLGFATS